MWRNKKLIIVEVLVAVMLVAMLGGIAVVRANDENTNQGKNNMTSLMEKVAEIYQANTGTAIDAAELQKAFDQAKTDIAADARNAYLQKLIDEGKITQEQADQYKAWLNSRPNFPTDEFKQWMESRPDIPALFGQANHGGMMPFGGMHRGGSFGFRMGNCLPGSDITK
jgi:competence protein ComGC